MGSEMCIRDRRKPSQKFRWSIHDVGTIIVLAGALLIGLTPLRGRGRLRKLWLSLLVAYFGLVTGNLLSLAVISGWTAQGIAWHLAPGLACVLVFSLLLSATTKRNLYCSHVCPHGAAQQLLKLRLPDGSDSAAPKNPRRWLKHVRAALKCVPGLLLFTATAITILQWDVNFAAWEAFDAWIWYVAGFASLSLGIGSLAVSAFVPMAYCRYACATGRLLEYVRHSAAAARFCLADAGAILLAVFAWWKLFQ